MEMIIVVFFIATVSAIAIPVMSDIAGSIVLAESQRAVQSELQQARLKAVTSNRILRVRFNCPVAQQFRIVELIGTPSLPASQDTASNRCSDVSFPYPAGDDNPVTAPNYDGPLRRLDSRVTFGTVQTIEFRPSGTAHSVNADGTSGPMVGDGIQIELKKGTDERSVTVNSLGKISSVSSAH